MFQIELLIYNYIIKEKYILIYFFIIFNLLF